jgi:hypothetical protein
VVIQHTHSSARYSTGTNARLEQLGFLVQGAVFTFFLISGYFFRVRTKQDKHSTLLVYLEGLSKRLLVPFVFLSAANAVAMIALQKVTAGEVVTRFATLRGVGPQMYFLPFLFVISFAVAIIQVGLHLSHRSETIVLLGMAAVLTLIGLHYPTMAATGADYRLLPLYLLMFLTGRLLSMAPMPAVLARHQLCLPGIIILIFGCFGILDFRFYYAALAVVAFEFSRWVSRFLPNRRAPGSGGVYLLHTPVLNYAISIGLLRFGIAQFSNAMASVALTYVLCLTMTVIFIKALPAHRSLLLE